MQLINICTNAIALFGAAYFIAALAAHLSYRWQHSPVKPIARVQEFNLLEVIDPCELLLLPPAVEPHPFELSLERMPALETIAAVHQPAAAVEPSIDLPPVAVEVAPHVEPDAPIGYQDMTSQQLRKVCSDRGIRWRSVKAGKHLSKPQMIAALSAV